MTNTSWREEYLTMKPQLSQTQRKLLKDGAWSLSYSWIFGAMRTDWKRIKGIKGIKDPAPPD